VAGAILGPMDTDPARVPIASVAPDPALDTEELRLRADRLSLLASHDEARLVATLDTACPLPSDATSD